LIVSLFRQCRLQGTPLPFALALRLDFDYWIDERPINRTVSAVVIRGIKTRSRTGHGASRVRVGEPA